MNLISVLVVSGIIFFIGLSGALTKRSAIAVLISLELSFNAVVLAAIGASRFASTDGGVGGYTLALVIIVVTAVESALAIALILAFYKRTKTVDITKTTPVEPVEKSSPTEVKNGVG